MIAAREVERLRRLGYPIRQHRTLIAQLVADAGIKVRPANRVEPRHGHWIGDCPACGREDGLWIAPDWRSFSTSCECQRRDAGPLALLRLVLLRGAA
jgi:hypothetical protein